MLDFSALNQARAQTSAREAALTAKSEKAFSEAVRLIEAFGNTLDTVCLQQALQKLQDSLASKSNQAEPYALLGLIFFSLEKPQLASKYFRHAQSISTDSPLVKKLKEAMIAGKLPTPASAGSNVNYDALYEEAEAFIRERTRIVLRQHIQSSQPVLAQADYQTLLQCLTDLDADYRSIQAQLDILHEEIDVLELKKQLKPLELSLAQYRKTLKVSEKMMDLAQRMAQAQKHVSAQIDRLEAAQTIDLASCHQELENTLDICDAVADHLDALEQDDVSIKELVTEYKCLIGLVEKWQEALEEHESAVGG